MKPVVNARFSLSLLALGCLAAVPAVHAEDAVGDALAKGKTNLEMRYRFENVDQAATPALQEANASTLRIRLRYISGEWQQASLMLEFDNVSTLGDERYNSSRNGKAAFPVVVDPAGTDLNQALVKYMGIANTPVTLGRQRVNLDNQRFIGSVGWRQNEQTLDGVMLEYKGIDRFTATYGFITQVNRINGKVGGVPAVATSLPEFDSESHLLNLKYVSSEALSAVAYAYLLDFDPNLVAASSSQTIGLRLTGAVTSGDTKFGYTAEYAQQSDYGNNPASFAADYALAEVTLGVAPIELQLGYERLGSDSGVAVQTPLATGHKFQGWADKFLTTPATGLDDVYAGVSAKVSGYGLALAIHKYDARTGGLDYGDEINVQVMKTFAKRYTLTFKYADYSQGNDAARTDTQKAWLMAEAKF